MKARGCTNCGNEIWSEFGSGLSSCCRCGNTTFVGFSTSDVWSPSENLVPRVSYTRRKRFKKYLNRACQHQAVSTVPDATWEYLLDHRPYRTAQDIIRTLKAAKHLKRKCYDSLPVLVRELVGTDVPMLNALEKERCMQLFDKVDGHVGLKVPFVSYLYTLEYCLHKIGRQDLLPYLSRIQCRKRRAKYNIMLDGLFGTPCHVPEIVHM